MKRFHLVPGKKVSPFGKVKPLNHLPQRQRREMFLVIAMNRFLEVQRTTTGQKWLLRCAAPLVWVGCGVSINIIGALHLDRKRFHLL